MKIKLFLLTLIVVMFSFVFITGCNEKHNPKYFEAKEATCVNDGNKAYWFCYHCDKAYSDEACENEISLESVVVPATGNHDFSEYATTIAPTETAKGQQTRYCRSCGLVDTKEIPELSHVHNLISHSEVKSTCMTKGKVAYYSCAGCSLLFADAEGKQEINKEDLEADYASHALVNHAAVSASCDKEGNKEYYTCQVCSKLFEDAKATKETTLEAVKVAKAAHTLSGHAVVAATCTANGTDAYYECSVCKGLFADDKGTNALASVSVIPAKGHTPEYHQAVEAKCDAKGSIEYFYCTTCKKAYADSSLTSEITTSLEVPAKGHNMTFHAGVDVTCKENGVQAYYHCANCNLDYADEKGTEVLTSLVIVSTGHDLVHHAAVAGDCSNRAVAEYYECKVCTKLYEDADAKVITTKEALVGAYGDHVKVHHAAKEVQCGIDGNKEYWECSACSKLYSDANLTKEIKLADVTIKATPHTLEKVPAVAAKCEESGMKEYWQCSNCLMIYKDEAGKESVTKNELIVLPKGHSTSSVSYVAPSLDATGVQAHFACKDCDKIFKDSAAMVALADATIPALTDAIWTKLVVKPTLSEQGYDYYVSDEFAPVKNKEGEASNTPSLTRKKMSNLFKKWYTQSGGKILNDDENKILEFSFLDCYDGSLESIFDNKKDF